MEIKSLLLVGLLFVAAPTLSQPDNNPQNPANWETLPTVTSGIDEFHRKSFSASSPTGVVSVHAVRNWANNIWVVNGTAIQGQDFAIPYGKIVNEGETLIARSQGQITMRLKWQGLGPAPASVQVVCFSNAESWYKGGGTGSADNGIETGSLIYSTPPSEEKTICSGSKLEYISVNGSGIAEKTISTLAYANVPCALNLSQYVTRRRILQPSELLASTVS